MVALIHGLGMNRLTWREFLPALSERYRVVLYDLVGHGESDAPTEPPTLRTFSDQLADLLRHLGAAPCVAVGFSLGGMINRRLAMDHPELVSALAILNSPHERGDEAQRLVEQRAADSAAGGPAATIDATLKRWFTPAFLADSPEVVAEARSWVLSNDIDVYAQCRWVLANGVVELIRPEPPIELPTLVMTCEHDSGSTPAMAQAIGAEIVGSHTIIVPNLQHLGLLEQPQLFVQPLLHFLG